MQLVLVRLATTSRQRRADEVVAVLDRTEVRREPEANFAAFTVTKYVSWKFQPGLSAESGFGAVNTAAAAGVNW